MKKIIDAAVIGSRGFVGSNMAAALRRKNLLLKLKKILI